MALHTSFNLIDMLFVGKLGKEAIAAVSMAFPVQLFIIAIGGGTGIGVTSLISRNIGAKDTERAKIAAQQCLFFIVSFGVLTALAGIIFAKDFFKLLGAQPAVLDLITDYIRPILLCSIFMYFNMIGGAIFRGLGDTVTPMKVMMTAVLLNIALDPLFIFGIGPFPRMEVFGAALATVFSRGIATLFLIYLLRTKNSTSKRIFSPRIDFKSIKNILNVGIPSSLAQLINTTSMLVLFSILTRFGTAAVAAFGLGFRLDTLAFLPGLGIASGNMIMIGQNFGAKKLDRVRKISMTATGITGGFMVLIGSIYFAFPNFWISLFNTDPELITYGTHYLRIVTISYFFIAAFLITVSSFQGSGRGSPALILTLLRLFVLLLPLTLILSKYYAIDGVWWAILLSNIISASIGLTWLHLYFAKTKRNFASAH